MKYNPFATVWSEQFLYEASANEYHRFRGELSTHLWLGHHEGESSQMGLIDYLFPISILLVLMKNYVKTWQPEKRSTRYTLRILEGLHTLSEAFRYFFVAVAARISYPVQGRVYKVYHSRYLAIIEQINEMTLEPIQTYCRLEEVPFNHMSQEEVKKLAEQGRQPLEEVPVRTLGWIIENDPLRNRQVFFKTKGQLCEVFVKHHLVKYQMIPDIKNINLTHLMKQINYLGIIEKLQQSTPEGTTGLLGTTGEGCTSDETPYGEQKQELPNYGHPAFSTPTSSSADAARQPPPSPVM